MSFFKLDRIGNALYINSKRAFEKNNILENKIIQEVFNFAYDMSFGNMGEHRDHRTGRSHIRKKGEIFANTFQGKLSEFALWTNLKDKVNSINRPDVETYDLGTWDSYDLIVNGKKVSVKSTKSFGNLLLLECKDWNNNAEYIPNIGNVDSCSHYDIFVLVRINPSCKDIMKKNRLLYSNFVEKENLNRIILNQKWEYDIAGAITNEDLKYIINNNYIIRKGELLNGKIEMDADNYYVQAGDMRKV